ncbi:hypothetical protein K443DRAFT_76055, partial [Laccaria amethystina LaAM-08-1]
QEDKFGNIYQDGLADNRQDGLADRAASADSGYPYNCLLAGSATNATPASSSVRSRRMPHKYYSVTVGRRCGVFTGWTYVHSLVNRAPGSACFGFKSREEAFEDYYVMKAKGHVRLSGREPGDEQEFGPISGAIM